MRFPYLLSQGVLFVDFCLLVSLLWYRRTDSVKESRLRPPIKWQAFLLNSLYWRTFSNFSLNSFSQPTSTVQWLQWSTTIYLKRLQEQQWITKQHGALKEASSVHGSEGRAVGGHLSCSSTAANNSSLKINLDSRQTRKSCSQQEFINQLMAIHINFLYSKLMAMWCPNEGIQLLDLQDGADQNHVTSLWDLGLMYKIHKSGFNQ